MNPVRWSSATALLLAATMLAVPAVGRADDAPAEPDVNWAKVLDYGLCGVSVYAAVGTGGAAVYLAALTCGKAMQQHWGD